MRSITALVVGVLALASCAPAGTNRDASGPTGTTANPDTPIQAVAAAVAFAAHSDPEVGVVDGYANLPLAVQRGEQPIAVAGGQANACAHPPVQGFTAAERAAIRAAFGGRRVHFVDDPAGWLGKRAPGSPLLVATRPLLGDQRGTDMVHSCVPKPQQVLAMVQWDRGAWQATATGAGKR